jgi:DNA-binding response OmpR family regulator
MCHVCVIGESDQFVAHLLLRFAEEIGLDSQWTTASQELLEAARQRQPAVIIFDPELPGKLRGWEVAKLLKDNVGTQDIPLVACSWRSEADIRAILGQDCGYLHKPDLHFREFVATLQAVGINPRNATELR